MSYAFRICKHLLIPAMGSELRIQAQLSDPKSSRWETNARLYYLVGDKAVSSTSRVQNAPGHPTLMLSRART